MADGDDPPPEVVPFRPKPRERSAEERSDVQWEILARREQRLGKLSRRSEARIPGRVRWWIAAAFIIGLVIVFRDRIAELLPGIDF